MKRKNPNLATEAKPAKKRSLKALARAASREHYVATYDDPAEQLRLLTLRHKDIARWQQSLESLCRDRTVRTGPNAGETIPCPLPRDARAVMLYLSRGEKARPKDYEGELPKHITSFDREMNSIKTAMGVELKKVPIYTHFLKPVFGLGEIVAAYLISEIDIHDVTDANGVVVKARKPSSLIQYAGLAVDNRTNRLSRRTRGQKNAYNSGLRVRIYQMFTAMLKNASPKKHGGDVSSKYLDIWANKTAGLRHKLNEKGQPMGNAYAFQAGWHTAARVFLNDLYIVWRTLEGLDVWPDYHAAKLGYGHGGKVVVNQPVKLTLEQALELVGDVGKYRIDHRLPLFTAAPADVEGDGDGEEEVDDVAAE